MDSDEESVYDVDGDSTDFEPEVKPVKAKAPPKKPAAPKAKAVSKKTTQTTLKTTKAAASKKTSKALESADENSDMDIDRDSLHDDSLLANTPPAVMKKTAATKKSSGKPLQPIDNESFAMDEDIGAKAAGTSTDKYQKLTQLEHIIKRPDTYIGSVERTEANMWTFNSSTSLMEYKGVNYVPGLYKIFDEILVNAADNRQNDKNMNEIKVTIDRETGEISVRNNGKGIPIEIHKKEGIYIPEMIFGHLLTSSNYDDNQAKVTGGRNGYGAKLCNVFSTEFSLETVDSKQGKKYKQTWTANMSKMGKAKITAAKGDDYTKVSFKPDFDRFGMSGIDDDFEGIAKRRVYDLAGTCTEVKVYLNGERIKITNFKKYMEMYTKAIQADQEEMNVPEAKKQVILTDRPNERWEIGFAVSDGSFQQVSFVNSIATTSGGTHVNYVADKIVTKLMEAVKKKNKGGVQLKPNQIKNHIFLFVNCLIVNPAFTSQTKEQLTTKPSQFGSKCDPSDKFLADIAKTDAVTNIIHFAQRKADQVLAKSDGNRRSRMNHAKLTDANKAGTKDGWKCTLILTEGDSASAMALAGRAVVNPDLFGVFPLRGKMLNVRDASVDQISKNAEIQNIKKFLGLQHKKEYTDTKGLRYGHLMIMTDQDHDGSHIKGLLINFLQVQFPSLLKLEGFLMEFITPIVKVWKGDPKNPRQMQSFFTMPQWEEFKETHKNEKGWDHKYFKGLGTSRPVEEGQVYFRDIDNHLKEFHTMKEQEAPLFDLAFSKKKADARKEWLRDFVPGTYIDLSVPKITYDDFVNRELILFSMADNQRSIPSVIDGFKPSQRKVLYCAMTNNIKKDVKVVDLAGTVSGKTDYQYGDTSLQQTIIGLAQTFVGSNNINCLEPSGNFGSRLQGGSDAASPRYVYTRLTPFARRIFHAADDALLTYGESDGKRIEPEMYVPILPMILVNGAEGIGTGWSTSIPNYKPEDIIDNLRRRMEGSSKEDMLPMVPWFRGFKGETEDVGGDRFKFTGTIKQTGELEVEITELPIRVWTQDFKDRLEEIIKAEKIPSFIKDYTEYNTPENVHFIIKMDEKHMRASIDKGLEETFKMTKTVATSNLVAFDAHGRMRKYETVLDIMEEFYHVRMKAYEQRKRHLLDDMQRDLDKMSNQSRFIKMIIDGKLTVSKKKKSVLIEELQRLGFKAFSKVVDAKKAGELEPVLNREDDDDDDGPTVGGVSASDYDYLLGMAIWSLTQERIEKLAKQMAEKEEEINELIKLSPKDLWNMDLDALIEEWQKELSEQAAYAKKSAKSGRRASTKLRIDGKGPKRKRKGGDSDDSDDDFAATKPKKAAVRAAPKTNSLTAYLTRAADPPKPVASVDTMDVDLLSGADEPLPQPAKKPTVKTEKPLARRGRPAGATTKNPKIESSPPPEDEDMDDVFTAIAKEAKQSKKSTADPEPPAKRARAATKKQASYALSSDSDDNGDDLLGDVSLMVKGIENGTTHSSSSRPLFSATARPSSSNGLAKSITRGPSKPVLEISDEDETDYTKLIPQPSPQRPAPRKVNDTAAISEDEEEDESFDLPKPSNVIGKAAAKPLLKAPAKSTAVASKVKPKAAPVLAKPVQLSPAAKAYAARKQKAAALPSKLSAISKKKTIIDDDSDEDDVDALANDLLSDDEEDDEPMKPKAKAKPAASAASSSRAPARPGRVAAASKPRYAVSDDSEEESEEASFDDDEDESD